jgi:hypothetical protein
VHPFRTPLIRNEPAKVESVTVLIVATCQRCEGRHQVALVNAQPVPCPGCGCIFSIDALRWGKNDAVPKISLSATPVTTLTHQ